MPVGDMFTSKPPSSHLEGAQSFRVVVADDDRNVRESVASILRGRGYIVELFEDGQEVIDRVAQGGVDLVMLDIVMPKLSGLEACRLLKGMTTDNFIPVVLVTGKTDVGSRVEGLKIGADDYICKPFDEQELLARVAVMLRMKRMHDHLAAERAKLERLSVHDEMTGFYNYRYLSSRLAQEFKRAERYHEPFACVLIDIDKLRTVNDTFGRGGGDAAIRRVAEMIRNSTRDVDVVARYGGEEFLLVLPSTHFAGSVAIAERIWRDVGDHAFDFEMRPVRLTVSIGISLYPSRDIRTKDALLRAADAAVSQAKREGGNRICVFQQQGHIFTPLVGASSSPSVRLTSDMAPSAPRTEGSGRKPL